MKTKKRLCASCSNLSLKKTLKSNKKKKPKWLNKIDYVENFIKNYKNFNNKYPNSYNKIMKLYVGKQHMNKKILYWAAKPQIDPNIIINDAKKAYGNFNNSGVSKIDNNGYALIKFNIPQNYKTIIKNDKKNTTFFKHLHYVISNKLNNKWINNIYSKLVNNNLNYNSFIKKLNSKYYVVLNALPYEVYAKDHIKDSYNLPYNIIKKMSTNELNKWFYSIIDLHYPILKKLLKYNKLNIYEIPIICYCAHNKCDASKILSNNLMKKGFVNVNLYEDGLKGYKENNK